MSKTSLIRSLLETNSFIVSIGVWDALSAKIVSRAGFPFLYMGSYAAAVASGLPRTELLTSTDLIRRASTIINAVEEPLIIDGDTGYGGLLSIKRTVESAERAGAAGIHFKDVKYLEKSGCYRESSLISKKEMVRQLNAAIFARKDSSFLVIAGTDGLRVQGIEDTLRRSCAYEAANADAIMISGGGDYKVSDLKQITSKVKTPCIWIGSETELQERGECKLSLAEIEDAGFRICIFPLAMILGAAKTMKDIVSDIKKSGATSYKMIDLEELSSLMGAQEMYNFKLRCQSGESELWRVIQAGFVP
jgi:2-methylisocitrate lyase-like PEP mutase family enzyme